MWKKRLFDEISSQYNNEEYAEKKRLKLVSDQFSCPQCSQSLTKTKNGLDCVGCEVTIPFTCQRELSPQNINAMIQSAKHQHRHCMAGHHSKVTCSDLGLPDGNDSFLIWTCGGCGQLEILL